MFEQSLRILKSGMEFLFLDGFEQCGPEDLQQFPMMELFVREL